MSNILLRADLWLIEKVFEPQVWKIEDVTGKNRYILARALNIVWVFSVCIWSMLNSMVLLWVPLIILIGWKRHDILFKLESIGSSLQMKNLKSPEKLPSMAYRRIIFIVFAALLIIVGFFSGEVVDVVAVSIMLIAQLLGSYVIACDDRPLSRQRQEDDIPNGIVDGI